MNPTRLGWESRFDFSVRGRRGRPFQMDGPGEADQRVKIARSKMFSAEGKKVGQKKPGYAHD